MVHGDQEEVAREPDAGDAQPRGGDPSRRGRRPRSSSAAARSDTTDRPTTGRSPKAIPPGTDFLAQLCAEWEAEARQAQRGNCASCSSVPASSLERSGGALPEMMRPFKFFVGGPIGSGRQYVSWIHRLDWIEIVRWIVQTPASAVRSTRRRRTPSPTASSHGRSAGRCDAPASSRRQASPSSSRWASSPSRC